MRPRIALVGGLAVLVVLVAIALRRGGGDQPSPPARLHEPEPAAPALATAVPGDVSVPSSPPPAAGGTASGDATVAGAPVEIEVVGEDDAPLAGVSVTLYQHAGDWRASAETDRGGRARVDAVPPGETWLTARAPGRAAATSVANVRAGPTNVVRIVSLALVPITGRVLLTSGAGVPAEVTAVRGGTVGGESETCQGPSCELAHAVAGADGAFRVEVPPNVVVTLRAEHAGYARAEVALRRGRAGEEVVLVLVPGGTLRGVVRDESGAPCADARVYVVPADEPAFLENPRYVVGADGSRSWTSSDDVESISAFGGTGAVSGAARKALRAASGPDGRYEVSGLSLGASYRALAEGCGGRGVSEEATFSTAATVLDADVALVPRATLLVRVRGPDGSEVREPDGLSLIGAREHFADPRGGAIDARGMDRGVVRFDGLLGGTYELRAQMPGSVPVRQTVEVPRSGTVEAVVRGRPGRTLVGLVVDRAGTSIGKAAVRVEVADAPGVERQSAQAASGDDGRFRVDGLQDAPGSVTAEAEGYLPSTVEDIRPGADVRLVLAAAPELRGRLRIRNGATLPNDVWVAAHDGTRLRWMRTAKVASEGAFRLRAPGAGPLVTLVLLPRVGAPVVLGRFALAAEEVRDVGDVVVDEGRVLRGRVVDRSGAPRAHVSVVANPAGAPGLGDGHMVGMQEATTDAEGRFAIRGVARGDAIVTTTHATLAPTVTVDRGHGDLTIVVHEGGFLSGRILDGRGAPWASQRFEVVFATDSGERAVPAFADPKGAFALGPLPVGPFVVRVGAPARDVARGVLGEGERRDVEWRVP